jgi:predicted AAA+ superfamily ATPase
VAVYWDGPFYFYSSFAAYLCSCFYKCNKCKLLCIIGIYNVLRWGNGASFNAKLPASAIFEQTPAYTEFKGALAENFVLTELISINNETPYYWKSGNTAEVDFVFQYQEMLVPVEVKAAGNIKSRSLAEYRKKYHPELAIKTSLRPPHQENNLLHLPLYLLFILPHIPARSKCCQ